MFQRRTPPSPPPEEPKHPLDAYLAYLTEKGHVSAREAQAIAAALKPWRARYSGLPTVERVRDELRADGVTVDALRRDEMAAWDNETRFPWFDLGLALDSFRAARSRLDQHLVFLSDAARVAQPPYVDPDLQNGELFFWIILRMYRVHAIEADA